VLKRSMLQVVRSMLDLLPILSAILPRMRG
jgi:hypothetical protein